MRKIGSLCIVLILSACAYAPLSPTPVPTATRTPTRLPTGTPTARAAAATAVTSDWPCTIAATRTPRPNAPTPATGTEPRRQIDPHVEICVSAKTLTVGETVSVVGQSVDIGLSYYRLFARDGGKSEPVEIAQVTYDNKPKPSPGTSEILEVVSAKGELWRVVFVLRARAPGTAQVSISATGEVHYGYPGPATWSGGGSESILIAVVSPLYTLTAKSSPADVVFQVLTGIVALVASLVTIVGGIMKISQARSKRQKGNEL